jgi:superfamily II DNA or RNA helicase
VITLYPYQQQFISDIQQALRTNNHVLAVAACGFGKSYCFSEIARKAAIKNKKVLLISHRLILLRQNNGALSDMGLEMVTINDHKKEKMDTTHRLYCSTAQTLQSRMKDVAFAEWLGSYFDLYLTDEAHVQHTNFLWESGLLDGKFVIGFTGSPRRNGNQRQLGLDWDVIVQSLPVQSLVDIWKLVPCRYFEVPTDISGLKVDIMTGDFQGKSQYQKFDNPELYGGMIKAYLKYGENRRFVCFCANISHCIKTCLQFIEAGIPTMFVVSGLNKPTMPDDNDAAAMERYKDHLESWTLLNENRELLLQQTEVNRHLDSGKIQGIITIEILSIGWDYKPLSCLILNRATQSLTLLIQMGGRVQRPFPGKVDSVVIDMGTNIARLGEFEKEHEWSVWHEQQDSVGIPAQKICPKCNKMILVSYAICPFPACGFRFATKEELREVELVERLKTEPEKWREMSAQGLCDFAELRGYKKSWVYRQLALRGETEFRKGMKDLGYDYKFIYGTWKRMGG